MTMSLKKKKTSNALTNKSHRNSQGPLLMKKESVSNNLLQPQKARQILTASIDKPLSANPFNEMSKNKLILDLVRLE